MSFVVLACDSPRAAIVVNDTNPPEAVEIYVLDEGSETFVVGIGARESWGMAQPEAVPSTCTKKELVARIEDGTEVERRPPGFSFGHRWRINGDPTD